jgi:flagellar protein FliL
VWIATRPSQRRAEAAMGTPVAEPGGMSDEPLKPAVAAPPKTSKALLGLLAVNVAVTGLVAFKVLTAEPEHGDGKPKVVHVESSSSEVTGPVVALDPFVVNLDETGTSRYLKVTLELELFPHGDTALTKSKQLVRDTILSYLSGLKLKDTLGAEAKDRLRQDLMAKLGKVVGPDKIRRMFFQDFVVQ